MNFQMDNFDVNEGRFVCIKCPRQVDPEERSQIILDIVIQRAQNCIQIGRDGDAAAWLHRFLTEPDTASILSYDIDFDSLISHLPLSVPTNVSSSVGSRWLTYRDQSICWMLFFHIVYFGHLPSSIFHPYPYDFVTRKDFYFVIDWSTRLRPDDVALSLVVSTLRVIVSEWRSKAHRFRHAYVAVMYSYIALLQYLGRDVMEIVDEITGGKEIVIPELAELVSIVLVQPFPCRSGFCKCW